MEVIELDDFELKYPEKKLPKKRKSRNVKALPQDYFKKPIAEDNSFNKKNSKLWGRKLRTTFWVVRICTDFAI